jgi:restriction system protein
MSESEDDRPVVPTDMAIEALTKHWPALADQIRMIYGVDSATFTDSAGAVITSPPSLPGQDLLPTLLMQTLVVKGDKTPDGSVIQAVTIPWKQILRLINDDPDAIYKIDPRTWEEIIAGSYRASGLFDEVILTPQSGDHGRDVIATKHGFCSIRCIESVKRYTPGKVVDADDVRALGFAMLADPKVNKGIVSTTWEFAPRIGEDPNIKSLLPYRLELVNKAALIERLRKWGTPE